MAQFTFSGTGVANISGTGFLRCVDNSTEQLYGTGPAPISIEGQHANADEGTYYRTSRKGVVTTSSFDLILDDTNTNYWIYESNRTDDYTNDFIIWHNTDNKWIVVGLPSGQNTQNIGNASDVANGAVVGSTFSADDLGTTTSVSEDSANKPDLSGVSYAQYYASPSSYTYTDAEITAQGTTFAKEISPPGNNDEFIGTYKAVGIGYTALSGNSSPYQTTMYNHIEDHNSRKYVVFERQADGRFYYIISYNFGSSLRATDIRWEQGEDLPKVQFNANSSGSTTYSVAADGLYYPDNATLS